MPVHVTLKHLPEPCMEDTILMPCWLLWFDYGCLSVESEKDRHGGLFKDP